jgi:hypothetical protein
LNSVSTLSAVIAERALRERRKRVERSEHVSALDERGEPVGALSAESTMSALNERVERSEHAHGECVGRAR